MGIAYITLTERNSLKEDIKMMHKIMMKLALGVIGVFGVSAVQATDFLFSNPGADIPSNAGDVTLSDGDYLTDDDTAFLAYTKDGIGLEVSGTQVGGSAGQVIQDLSPNYGGLAINDGTGGTDNMNDGETLTIDVTTGGILLNSVSFFDEDHGIPINLFTDNGNDVKLEIFNGATLVTTLWFALTDSQASFLVGFHGDRFVFTATTGSDNWYISTISVPEPATLALLGIGLLGFGIARRRKS